jgi:membrane-associated protein
LPDGLPFAAAFLSVWRLNPKAVNWEKLMEQIRFLFDLFLHLDEHLSNIINQYGVWTYAILFLIIFMETGFVVTPFLPGDSLLFAAGTFAALGSLNVWLLIVLLIIAAIAGDTVNYWIGHYLGDRAYNIKWIKKEYLDRTHTFFTKHGGKTIFLARFVPIVRTFAPFVAGMGRMSYGYFFSYNVFGGIVWVLLFTLLGYFFGNIPFVKANFELVIIAIILISVLPAVWEAWKARREIKLERAAKAAKMEETP